MIANPQTDDVVRVRAHRIVYLRDVREAEAILERGLFARGASTRSEVDLRRSLTVEQLRRHIEAAEGKDGLAGSPFLSFSSPLISVAVDPPVLEREGIALGYWTCLFDDDVPVEWIDSPLRSMFVAIELGEKPLATVVEAALDVRLHDPLRAIGDPELAIDTRFLSPSEWQELAGALSEDHREREAEVTAQLSVPPSRIISVRVHEHHIKRLVEGLSAAYPLVAEFEGECASDLRRSVSEQPWRVDYVSRWSANPASVSPTEMRTVGEPASFASCPISIMAVRRGVMPGFDRVDLSVDGVRRIETADGTFRVIGVEQTGATTLRVEVLRLYE